MLRSSLGLVQRLCWNSDTVPLVSCRIAPEGAGSLMRGLTCVAGVIFAILKYPLKFVTLWETKMYLKNSSQREMV